MGSRARKSPRKGKKGKAKAPTPPPLIVPEKPVPEPTATVARKKPPPKAGPRFDGGILVRWYVKYADDEKETPYHSIRDMAQAFQKRGMDVNTETLHAFIRRRSRGVKSLKKSYRNYQSVLGLRRVENELNLMKDRVPMEEHVDEESVASSATTTGRPYIVSAPLDHA